MQCEVLALAVLFLILCIVSENHEIQDGSSKTDILITVKKTEAIEARL